MTRYSLSQKPHGAALDSWLVGALLSSIKFCLFTRSLQPAGAPALGSPTWTPEGPACCQNCWSAGSEDTFSAISDADAHRTGCTGVRDVINESRQTVAVGWTIIPAGRPGSPVLATSPSGKPPLAPS